LFATRLRALGSLLRCGRQAGEGILEPERITPISRSKLLARASFASSNSKIRVGHTFVLHVAVAASTRNVKAE
jgi:hypothetical protein